MQEMDNVRVTVEKETYSQDGVHKGMYGWICYPKCVKGYWLVNFPQCGEKDDIAEISIKEEDLEMYTKMAYDTMGGLFQADPADMPFEDCLAIYQKAYR